MPGETKAGTADVLSMSLGVSGATQMLSKFKDGSGSEKDLGRSSLSLPGWRLVQHVTMGSHTLLPPEKCSTDTLS